MIASVHLADVGAGTALKVMRTVPDTTAWPGLRYASTVASAPLGGSLFSRPQPRRVGLIALWDDDAGLDRFLAGNPVAVALAGGWHARLAPVNVHEYHRARGSGQAGTWPGLDGDMTDRSRPDGPTAVLTLARTRASQLLRFGRASVQAARPLAGGPGLIWATALARPPVVATFSLWASPAAVEAYAYGPAGSGHRQAMAADRKEPFHQSGAFLRLCPVESVGHLDGRNPLPGDWMTAEAPKPAPR